MRVELLYFDGCPLHSRARQILEGVLRARDVPMSVVRSIRVEAGTASDLRFVGSPTIRVDGTDVEPDFDETSEYGLRCRLYPTPDHLPDVSWIASAVDAALRRRHE